MEEQRTLAADDRSFPIGPPDHGPDTLLTALRTGWTIFAVVKLVLVRIDPRQAVAAC